MCSLTTPSLVPDTSRLVWLPCGGWVGPFVTLHVREESATFPLSLCIMRRCLNSCSPLCELVPAGAAGTCVLSGCDVSIHVVRGTAALAAARENSGAQEWLKQERIKRTKQRW
jgi:hypothetical protein